MKLIIDIPDEDYNFIKDLRNIVLARGNTKTVQYHVINAIKNGAPYEDRTKGKWLPVSERLPRRKEGDEEC